VKRIAALLLAGLLTVPPVFGQTAATPGSDPQSAPKTSSGRDYITLNFSNVDISALVKVMSEYTRKNFVLDDKVTGKVTLMTPTKVSPEEAYQIFLSALEIKGFTAVEDGKITRIVPTSMARQSGLKVIRDNDMQGQGYVTKVIHLNYVSNPQDVVRTLTPLISRDGSILAYPETNSIIVTDSVFAIRKIEQLVQAMDIPTPTGKGKINVVYLKYASAEDIAKVMQALVSRIPIHPGGAAAAPAGPATILEGTVTITSDKLTNSLIVVGSPSDFETIKEVIAKLDIRRRQVYVEAAIIEMGLSKSRELGFEFQATNLDTLEGSNKIQAVGGTNFPNASSGQGIVSTMVEGPAAFANFTGLAVGAVKGTFTFNGTEYLNIGALLRALQSDSDVNVLSTPNVLTTDNQKAEIMVGENIPFITGQSQTPATGGGAILTSVDRKDVGISLKITPQITSDDNVRLDINQEISNVTQTPGLNPNVVGPSINKRAANTTVVVKDRETVVIGGLIRDNLVTGESKVPLLGDIPILGWFFKYKSTQIEKTNLMIFITPYIIKNENDALAITQRKGDALSKFREENRIPSKDMGGLIESRKPAPANAVSGPSGTVVPMPDTTNGGVEEPEQNLEPQSQQSFPSSPTGTSAGPAGPMPGETSGGAESRNLDAQPEQSLSSGATNTAGPAVPMSEEAPRGVETPQQNVQEPGLPTTAPLSTGAPPEVPR
jgi:general secretion pathway protein D